MRREEAHLVLRSGMALGCFFSQHYKSFVLAMHTSGNQPQPRRRALCEKNVSIRIVLHAHALRNGRGKKLPSR